METVSLLSLLCASASVLALLLLHFVSTEFQPTWRMISEYANGKHKWLITTFFFGWGLSSFFAALAVWPQSSGAAAVIGCVFLVLAGIGEIMGGLFDIKHKLHGLSFMLGVPALPIAALLISYNCAFTDGSLKLLAHATWISLVLMGLSMGHMFAQFKKFGLAIGPEAKAPEQLPKGMFVFSGIANRLLVVAYQLWVIVLCITL